MAMRPQFQRLVEKIRMRPPLPAAVVHPCDSDSLQLALSGAFAGYLAPLLIGPGDLPLMALPAPGGPAAQQVFGNEKAVKFNILPTGTTLGAGFANASNDPVTHNTFSADQKLYGPLHVTTAVTDVGQTTSSKSISAGFKLNW